MQKRPKRQNDKSKKKGIKSLNNMAIYLSLSPKNTKRKRKHLLMDPYEKDSKAKRKESDPELQVRYPL